MVLEHVDIRILPGMQDAFEAAIVLGMRTVITRAQGMLGYRLDKCVETPERYLMQITWARIQDHMVAYKQGPLSPEFRAIVEPYFAQIPVMQHFELVAQGPAPGG